MAFFSWIYASNTSSIQTIIFLSYFNKSYLYERSTYRIVITDVADHFEPFLVVSNKSAESPPNSELKRIIYDSNIKLFKRYLNKTDFSAVSYIPCPNEVYNKLISLYKNAFNAAFPL